MQLITVKAILAAVRALNPLTDTLTWHPTISNDWILYDCEIDSMDGLNEMLPAPDIPPILKSSL
ncbi:hypothetical protein D3C87_2039930 [compost metagenome]